MFKCNHCCISTEPRQPVNRVVTERRWVPKWPDSDSSEERWEIAKEIKTCPHCYTTLTGMQPAVKTEPQLESIGIVEEPKEKRRKSRKWKNPKVGKSFDKESPRKRPEVKVVNKIYIEKR